MYPSQRIKDHYSTPRVIPLAQQEEQTTTTDESWSLPLSDRKVRPQRGRGAFRTICRFCVAVLIGVGLTLGWQSYGDAANDMIRSQAPWLSGLLPGSTTKIPTATTPTAAGISSEVVQQLEPMAHDLAAVRRSVDELAGRQEQLAQYVAGLRVVEQDIMQKMSFSPLSGAVFSPPSQLPQPAAPAPAARPFPRANGLR